MLEVNIKYKVTHATDILQTYFSLREAGSVAIIEVYLKFKLRMDRKPKKSGRRRE